MRPRSNISYLLLASFLCIAASPAHAHFKLLKPASWLKEDSVGGPQKGSPCGPGGTGLLGDDVQPVPLSNEITTFSTGEKITVELQETVYHPGYFRIALVEDRSKFDIPPVDDPASCALDLDKVPTGAHDGYVLADGLFKEESLSGSNRQLKQDVTLPNEPCEKCTLQVVQVMKDHGLSSCYYYHCADIKIVAASSSAGSGGAAAGAGGTTKAGAAGVSGMSAAGVSGMSTAGTAPGVAGLGSAGMSLGGAGSVATASGRGAVGARGAAGIGSTSSPTTAAGTPATTPMATGTGVAGAIGTVPPAAPPANGGGSCSVARRSPGFGDGFVCALSAVAAFSLVCRRRLRASTRARNG